MNRELEKTYCLKVIDGDEDAFTEIFLAYNCRLKRFICSYTNNSTLAEDVVQETFILLWEIREILNPEKSLLAFLLTIAKNKALNALKKQKSNLTSQTKYRNVMYREMEVNIQSMEYLLPHGLIVKDIESIIKKTLSGLPSKTREIFEMSRYGGIKNKDIAEQLSISIKTVEYHLSKALCELKVSIIRD